MGSKQPITGTKAPVVTKLSIDTRSSRPPPPSTKSTKGPAVPITRLISDLEEEEEEKSAPLPQRPKAEKLPVFKPIEPVKAPITKTLAPKVTPNTKLVIDAAPKKTIPKQGPSTKLATDTAIKIPNPKPVPTTKLVIDSTPKKSKSDPAPVEPNKSAIGKLFGLHKTNKEDRKPAIVTKLHVDTRPNKEANIGQAQKKPAAAQTRPSAPIKAPVFQPPPPKTAAKPVSAIQIPTKLHIDAASKKATPAQQRPTAPIKAPVFKLPAPESAKQIEIPTKLHIDAAPKKPAPTLRRPSAPIKAPAFVPPAQSKPAAPVKAPVFKLPPPKPAPAPIPVAPTQIQMTTKSQVDPTPRKLPPSRLQSPPPFSPSAPNIVSRAPPGTASTFTSQNDRVMAARQTTITQMAPDEREEQERWAQNQLQSNAGTGACVAGFGWNRIDSEWMGTQMGGYQCQGGSHLVTDALLAEGLGGYYTAMPDYNHTVIAWVGPCYDLFEVLQKVLYLKDIYERAMSGMFVSAAEDKDFSDNCLHGKDGHYVIV